jgi:tyrosyl-tRNA synthetase
MNLDALKALKSPVLIRLHERGFIKDYTNLQQLDELCLNGNITVYSGYDLTANSLHAGNLMTLMMLRIFQQYGHRIIALLGGATTKIGDPTGRDTARLILSDEQIAQNLKGITGNLHQILGKNVKVVNNYDWLSKKGFLEILCEIGSHFSINRMIKMDSVESRLKREQLMTFLEFNYMIFQGYDFYHLTQNENCVLQVGGSDQWGNILQGVELNARILQKETFALTCPLITKSDGTKMGKSVNGAVWLSKEKLSHFEYFQYFRNISDADVLKCLRFFTELPMEEIQKLEKLQGKEINEAKKALALEATKIVHGEALANDALQSAVAIHEQSTTNIIMEEVFVQASNILDVLVEAGLAQSRGDAKKLVAQNAIKIDDETCKDITTTVQNSVIKKGKRVMRIICNSQ